MKAPKIGSYVWVVDTKGTELGASYVKRIKVRKLDLPYAAADPASELPNFFGIYDGRCNYYHFDIVFDTEAKAKRRVAANIRLAIRKLEQRLRDNNSALLRLRTSLAKLLEMK